MFNKNQTQANNENQIQVYSENQLQTTEENQISAKRSEQGFCITTQNRSIDISDAVASEALHEICRLAETLIYAGSAVIAKYIEQQQEKHFNTLKLIIACRESTREEREKILECVRDIVNSINNIDITKLDKQSQKNLRLLTRSYEKNLRNLLKEYRYHFKLEFKAMK